MPLLRRPSSHCSVPNMKLLGYLFVFAIVLAAVGYVRGWFTVNAAGKDSSAVAVAVDRDRMARDAHAVLERVGAAPATDRPVVVPATVASHVVEGRLTAVAPAARQITVAVAAREVIHHVPASVAILRGGERLGFAELRPDQQVRLTLDGAEPIHVLLAVEILP